MSCNNLTQLYYSKNSELTLTTIKDFNQDIKVRIKKFSTSFKGLFYYNIIEGVPWVDSEVFVVF